LREKKANQLDAIIGLLPNSTETGKFLLTVDAQFAFRNILGQGEGISVSYQSLQYKSPRLKADVIYPYLFGTPFGVEGHFDLYKKDTSFRRTSFQAGVRYQLSPTDYLRVFYQNQSNRLITIDTGYVRSNKKLPENIDVAANGAGLEISFNRTDYRLNPRKGWEASISTSALVRRIRKSDAITGLRDGTGFSYGSLYDSLLDRQYQYLISGHVSNYQPLGRKAVFKTAYNGGWVGGKSLFRNELYQIGGFRLLRGFDEQSIFTNQYHVLSLELRLLLDQNSYFYLFSDNGYIISDFSGFYKDDIYNGFGMGTTLETKSGLFTISYGLGRNSANPIQFRESKIHFGYIAYF
jgi:outer membrane protein assembly factor BamA